MITYREFKRNSVADLRKVYSEREAGNIIDLLFYHFAGVEKINLLKDPSLEMNDDVKGRLEEAVKKILTRIPVQHIIGEVEFLDCRIGVNNKVLIPRPETGELVNELIRENPDFKGKILDVGTGSGCIPVAIKKHLENAEVMGVDISPEALKVAKKNSEDNLVNVRFEELDFLDATKWELLPVFDMIISNPPYIPRGEKKELDPLVVDNEPWEALFIPDEDPLVFYKAIAHFARDHLVPEGMLYLEIHENFFYQTAAIFKQSGFTSVEVIRDMQDKNRFLKAKK